MDTALNILKNGSKDAEKHLPYGASEYAFVPRTDIDTISVDQFKPSAWTSTALCNTEYTACIGQHTPCANTFHFMYAMSGYSNCLRNERGFLLPGSESVSRVQRTARALKVYGCGDDAFFASKHALAVADGVGGWHDSKTGQGDPAFFSRSLLHAVHEQIAHLRSAPIKPTGAVEPLDMVSIVEEAASSLHAILGSCTVAVAWLKVPNEARMSEDMHPAFRVKHVDLNAEKDTSTQKDTATLHIYNLGDSGVLIMRQGAVIFSTEEQGCQDEYPYQIGSLDLYRATDGEQFEVQVQERDVVIVATYGLLFNLDPDDISKYAKPFLKRVAALLPTNRREAYVELHLMAHALKEAAWREFGKGHKIEYIWPHSMDDSDDISVVAGIILHP